MNTRRGRRIVAATAAAVAVLVGLAVWALVVPSRRETALLVGAGVATAAAAISTWPSRRLVDESRPGDGADDDRGEGSAASDGPSRR